MRFEILVSSETQRVSPQDIADFSVFAGRRRPLGTLSDIQVFERFYAARSLMNQGMETFLDPILSDTQGKAAIRVDVCGIRGSTITAYFCETGSPSSAIAGPLQKIQGSENASAVVLVPTTSDLRQVEQTLANASENERTAVETLGWLDDQFDATFQQALRLIDIIGNETRMRMLAPLFRKTEAKKDYRAKINPKLVYQNLSVLVEAGLVNEVAEGTYGLSDLGKSILAEFITFLEKTRKTLDSVPRQKEVKNV